MVSQTAARRSLSTRKIIAHVIIYVFIYGKNFVIIKHLILYIYQHIHMCNRTRMKHYRQSDGRFRFESYAVRGAVSSRMQAVAFTRRHFFEVFRGKTVARSLFELSPRLCHEKSQRNGKHYTMQY